MNEVPTVRVRLDLAYDGTAFSGWARQPGLRTVQGVLEEAIATVLRRGGPAPTLTVAGRTDAGVHATGQVAHLDLTPRQLGLLAPRGSGRSKARPHLADEPGSPTALARRINGIVGLASDVHVSSATIAPPGFDARFSPVWRSYEYRIADATAEHNPLLRNHTVWFPGDLDLDAMNHAARSLMGLHDWAAYCRPREGATTIRTLQEFVWTRDEHGVLVARLRADAFCHSMVRSLVGATVSVGQGRLAEDRLVGIRDEARRTSEFKVMPAAGLVLVEVGFPPDAELAARAEQTRARREPAID